MRSKLLKPAGMAGAMLAAAALAAGCGYHLAASGSSLPATARTVYVDRFHNLSRDTGVEEEFARHLKDEIANHKRLELVDDPAAADLRLSGQIDTVSSSPAGFNAVAEPTSYAGGISVDATLIDSRTNKVLWSTRGLTRQQIYGVVAQSVVSSSPEFLQQNLRPGDLARMSDAQVAATQSRSYRSLNMDELAHDVYVNMTEGF